MNSRVSEEEIRFRDDYVLPLVGRGGDDGVTGEARNGGGAVRRAPCVPKACADGGPPWHLQLNVQANEFRRFLFIQIKIL